MPTVPTYDQSQVFAESDPNSYVPSGNAGEQFVQLGAALQGAGSDLGSIALDQQHQANADTVLKTETSFKNDYLKYQQSLSDRKGQNAWNITNDVNDWFDKAAPQYKDSLANDAQRRAFGATFDSIRTQALESTGKFEADQRRQSVEESGRDSIQASINIAAADHNNLATIEGAKSDITKRVQLLGQLNGWSPEIRDAQMTSSLTNLHKQVIQALVDDSPSKAQAYLNANRNEIAGSQLDELDKMVRVGTISGQSQLATADILSRHSSETDALAEVRARYNGPVQDAITTRIKEQFAEQQTILERNQKQAGDKAYHTLTTGAGYDAIPPSLLAQMSGEQVKSLQDEAARRANGSQVQTDWGTFQKLRQQIFQQPNRPFDITPYLGDLNEGERKSLIDLSTSLASPKTQHDAVTVEKQINDSIAQLGYPKTPNTVQRATIGQLKSQADQAFMDFQTKTGRKPIDTERQAILDGLLQPGTVPGRVFGTNDARRIEALSRGDAFTPKPPAEGDRQLSKSGKPMMFSRGQWEYVQ